MPVDQESRRGGVKVGCETWLDSLYAASGIGDAIDAIMDHFDDSFHAGEFAAVDAILAGCDVSRLGSSAIVSLLIVSGWAVGKLPTRAAFVVRAEARLIELTGTAYAAELMEGIPRG